MAQPAIQEPTTAAEVMQRVRQSKAYFTALGKPLAQLERANAQLTEEIKRLKGENYELKSRLAEYEIPEIGRGVNISLVQQVVCGHFEIARVELVSERRTTGVVYPRQIAMYLCKTLTLHSYPEIGRRFGGRDHTTVLHAVRKVAFDRDCKPDVEEKIQTLTRTILEVTNNDDAHKSQG